MSTGQKRRALFASRTSKTFSSSLTSVSTWTGPYAEERLLSLFEPDVLVPAQYLETTRRRNYSEPERKLMLAILEDGIWCFQNGLVAKSKTKKNLFSEAEEWILDDGKDWLFSFDNVCEILALNASYIRKGLMRWKEEALKGRVRARVYHITHLGEKNKKSASEPREKRQRLLEAAGF